MCAGAKPPNHSASAWLAGQCFFLFTDRRYAEFANAARLAGAAVGCKDVDLACECKFVGALDAISAFVRHKFVCPKRMFRCHVRPRDRALVHAGIVCWCAH